jgi:type II secretory pathway component PulF
MRGPTKERGRWLMTELGLGYDRLPYLTALSQMLACGVQLLTSLRALSEFAADVGLAETHEHLIETVATGRTLSQAMSERPDDFGPFVVAMVRAGEVGGAVHEALEKCAQQLALEQKGWYLRHLPEELQQRLGNLAASEEAERFCWRLASLLGSGAPILEALPVAEEGMTGPRLGMGSEACERLREGQTSIVPVLEKAGLPLVVTALVRAGEESGELDKTMLAAGFILLQQTQHRRQKQVMELRKEGSAPGQ